MNVGTAKADPLDDDELMEGFGTVERRYQEVEFKRPFWLAPHAKERFRQRFGPYDDPVIERIINVQLQPPEIPDAARINIGKRGPSLFYAIIVNDEPATAVVGVPEYVDLDILPRDPDVWPAVMTVYPGRKHIAKYQKALKEIRSRPVKPFEHTWQLWEVETVKLMRWIGYTLAEIAVLLGRTEKQLESEVWRGKLPRVEPRWTEDELQIACDMRFDGKTYAQIGKRLGKSPQAVKNKMLRHRRWVMENPERVAFMRILHWTKDPGKFLRHLRKTDMVAHVATLHDRIGEEDEVS